MTGSRTRSRRFLLRAMAGVGLAALGESPALAGGRRGTARILMLSDLHSAYGRLAPLLTTMRRVVRRDAAPCLILLNGDLFEAGNVVARRTDGALDWAFLRALTGLAPVVLNLGNHDADLADDLARTVARARAMGITVLSTIGDARSGRPLAPSRATLDLGFPVHLIGIATNALDTYPKALRPSLALPAPVAWVASSQKVRSLATLSSGALPATMAELKADRDMLL